MQTTLRPDLEIVARAKAQLEASTTRLLHLLSFVPDDRLDWAPSPTAKSAIRLLTHAARSDRFFAQVIAGTLPSEMPSVERFFADLHAADSRVTKRESVVALLGESTAELQGALDSVTAETLDTPRDSPVGAHSPAFWIGIVGEHRATHTGQLEYFQTIWGDLDNHMG